MAVHAGLAMGCIAEPPASSVGQSWGCKGSFMDVSASSEEQSCSRAALSVVSILQVLGKEHNKACFPFALPSFIPDLSSDLKEMV